MKKRKDGRVSAASNPGRSPVAATVPSTNESAPKSRWEELRSWVALIVALASFGISAWDRMSSRDERSVASRIANQEDLAVAFDLLGGQTGTTTISLTNRVPSRATIVLAEQRVQKALTRVPGDATALWLRGMCKQFRGQNTEAEADYKESAARSSAEAWRAQNSLGGLYSAIGRLSESIAAYEEAIRLRPQSEVVRYNIGLAYMRSGDLKAAELALNNAVRLDQTFGEAFLALAEVYRRRNELQKAKSTLNKLNGIPEPFRSSTAESPSKGGETNAVIEDAGETRSPSVSPAALSPAAPSSKLEPPTLAPLFTVATLPNLTFSIAHTSSPSYMFDVISSERQDFSWVGQYSSLVALRSGEPLIVPMTRGAAIRAATPAEKAAMRRAGRR
jgi:tetratricopeptide (TPR) repeat protein